MPLPNISQYTGPTYVALTSQVIHRHNLEFQSNRQTNTRSLHSGDSDATQRHKGNPCEPAQMTPIERFETSSTYPYQRYNTYQLQAQALPKGRFVNKNTHVYRQDRGTVSIDQNKSFPTPIYIDDRDMNDCQWSYVATQEQEYYPQTSQWQYASTGIGAQFLSSNDQEENGYYPVNGGEIVEQNGNL
jgi:hypothetical protein